MSNFEYIISSLPWLTTDYKYADGQGFQTVLADIRDNLGEQDNQTLDFLLKGFQAEELGADFYAQALKHPSAYIREYFRFDLNLRNAKVRYLNHELGRQAEQDVVSGEGGPEDQDLDIDLYRFHGGEFEEERKVAEALALPSLLDREVALDEIMWEKADSLSTFHYFDLTAVLAYVSKLHLVDRWLVLDQEKGRELFRQLVQEVKGTFKGVKFNA